MYFTSRLFVVALAVMVGQLTQDSNFLGDGGGGELQSYQLFDGGWQKEDF